MYKALIVEDESLELNALHQIIKTHCSRINQIKTCDNGEDVTELLETFSPDIVLMDIHLGNTNGIDIANLILTRLPNTRIIVITAFDQFSYAQKAIQFGLADYLLKPVTTTMLLDALNKQLNYLDKQHASLLERLRQQAHISKLQDSFFTSLMNNIICNHMNPNTSDIMHSLKLPSSYMQIYIIQLDTHNYEINKSEFAILKKLVIDSLQNTDYPLFFLYDIMASDEIVLCTFSEEISSAEHTSFSEIIQNVLSHNFHIPYRISISAVVSDPFQLPFEYKQALGTLQTTAGTFCASSDITDASVIPLPINELVDTLTNTLLCLDSESLDFHLEHLYKTASSHFTDFSEIQSHYITIWVETMQEIKIRLSLQSQISSLLLLNPIANFIETQEHFALHTCFKKHFSDVLKKIKQLTNEKKNYTALRAQRYIDAHYAQPLTLQTIADSLHMSPYYLCHTFKDSLNTGVIEYLNYVRIEAAKQLLQSQDQSIKDIAFAVGFSDPNYFCRAFKRVTGMTPSTFKRLL